MNSDISLYSDDIISCLPVYKYTFFSLLLFLSFQFLFFWKYSKRYIIYRIIDCGGLVVYAYSAKGTVYFMEWSHGVESWSGVIEWSLGGKCWSGSVGLNSNKASPYFIT